MTLQVGKEVDRLAGFVRGNLDLSLKGLAAHDASKNSEISDNEEVIDYLTGEITDYLTRASVEELPPEVSEYLGCVYSAINDLEQIGDHALRLMEENEKNLEEKLIYSDEASKELEDISAQVLSLLDTAMACFSRREITLEQWSLIKKEQRKVVRMSSQAQSNHMERLRDKKCTFEQGLTFVESLNSLSRIVNHVANIAETMLSAEVRGGLPGQNVG